MNLESISTELSAISAKIDSFTRMEAAMADQQKILEKIAVSSAQPSTISGPVKRDENTERQLACMWNEIDKMHREMAEQKAEGEQAAARQETKLDEMRSAFEDLRATLSSLKNENDSLRGDLMNLKAALTEQKAETVDSATEKTVQALASQRTEIDKIREEISALQATLTSKIQLSGFKEVDDVDAEILRKINSECQYSDTNDEDIKRIFDKVKSDKSDIVKFKQTMDLLEEISVKRNFVNIGWSNPLCVLREWKQIMSRELIFQNPIPSSEYIKLICRLLLFNYDRG
jgi:regulator of replication initiation timing